MPEYIRFMDAVIVPHKKFLWDDKIAFINEMYPDEARFTQKVDIA